MATRVAPQQVSARLRAKNQITLPDEVLKQVGAEVGDRFSVSVEHGHILLERIRRSYAGAFPDLWPDNWMEELRAERDDWARRENV